MSRTLSPEQNTRHPKDAPEDQTLEQIRRNHVARVLHATGYDLAAAAAILGILPAKLSVMIRRLGIS